MECLYGSELARLSLGSFYPVLYEIFHRSQPGQEVYLRHVTFLILARMYDLIYGVHKSAFNISQCDYCDYYHVIISKTSPKETFNYLFYILKENNQVTEADDDTLNTSVNESLQLSKPKI